eukprot:g29705.t1
MWDVRVTISVPSDFTCEKCTQLQLFTARVRELELELELELDELQITWEAEGVIDRCYKEVVAPKLQDIGSWVTVRRGKGNRQIVQGSPVAVPLNNKYTTLDTVDGDDLPGESHSVQISGTEPGSVAQKGRGENSKAIVIGDSMVRATDRRFCDTERDSQMVCYLPGARVRDVSDRVFRILEGRESSQKS